MIRKLVIFLLIGCFIFSSLLIAKETIILWDQKQETEKIVKMFNEKMGKEGKEIEVKLELIPYDQMVPKFMASLSTGRAPDLYGLDIVQFPYFISIGAFADITEWAKALPFFEELPNGMIQVGMKDNRIFALPYQIDLSTILWNKDMFKEAGLDPEQPPKTWYELVEIGQKLTIDKDGDGIIDQWGFNLAGGGAGAYMFWFMPFVWGNGGSMFDNDGNVVLDSYETVEALQFWSDLIHKYKIAPVSSVQYGSGDRYNAFVSGKLAIYLGGNFNITSLLKDAPNMDFGVASIPKNRGSYASFGGGSLLGITSQCKNIDAAKEFMKFVYSEEAQIEAYAPDLQLLARPSLYDNKYYNEIPQMEDFAEILSTARTPYSIKYNEIYDPVQYYFESVFLGEMDAKTAVEKCTTEIKEILGK
ncbi:MAG: multiple sugar transport system substrate-binding protein [Kosmotogales bacterium]|nr:multiple sugar transport system substrate-binding protein [Kosmotogales bacterium]